MLKYIVGTFTTVGSYCLLIYAREFDALIQAPVYMFVVILCYFIGGLIGMGKFDSDSNKTNLWIERRKWK